ncbi:MAG TPA: alpha/beta fold hydrolase [Candidatus Dormibacteraeota bacterium]|nr:alpha/beta fold hydrolase [Candidatus Dormibacteraeota bacterium]
MYEGWVERAGVRLHYLEWRPSDLISPPPEPALFLLHGLSSNARVWERTARLLPARRIVALDQRSHGLSDRPATGYALDDVVADAAHVIRELGLGRPLVAGHSWGAAVALSLTAAHPELASGLVNVDGPTASFSRFMTWEEAAQRMQPPLPTYRDSDEAAAAQADDLGDAWGDDLREFVSAGLSEAPAGSLAPTLTAEVRVQILRNLYGFEPELLFAGVEGPILLAMAGQVWPGAPQEFVERRRRSVEEVRELRPDAQVRWYESRHDVPLIRPAELAGDVERTAIAAAFWSLAREAAGLAGLPRGDWARPAQGDDGGWDAKDVLAHLSSTQAAMANVIGAPSPGPGDGAREFDSARWNASQLRRRKEQTPTELAAEMRRGTEQAQAALMGTDLAALTAIGPYAGTRLNRAMELMLDHQRRHMAELRAALA